VISALNDWVKTIILVVLFASFLELLLPASSMQRFVRVIMGLLVMLTMLNPVVEFIQSRSTPQEIPALGGRIIAGPGPAQGGAAVSTGDKSKLAVELYKKDLARQTRGEKVRVVLRVALPRSHFLELEDPSLEVRHEHPVLEPLDRRQRFRLDLVEPAQVSGQCTDLPFKGLLAQVLEVIVIGMHAVERGVRRMSLVEIGEQVVNEMRQRFRNDHRLSVTSGLCRFSSPAVLIRQWYNKLRSNEALPETDDSNPA